MIDVRAAVGAGVGAGPGGGVAKIGAFVGLEAIGDAHFVEISIAGKREQAGVLGFPAEAAYPGLAGSLEAGSVDDLAANLFVVFLALVLGEINKSLIGDGFHESIAENVQRNAEGTNVLRIWNAFLNFRAGEGPLRANGGIVPQ